MLWAIVGVIALFALVTLAALVLCAGGGAWSPDDEEPMFEADQPAPRPYMSPAGYHRHRCSRCNLIWEHPNYFEGVELAHLCPECSHDDSDCGRCPRYYGPLPPDVKYARGTP